MKENNLSLRNNIKKTKLLFIHSWHWLLCSLCPFFSFCKVVLCHFFFSRVVLAKVKAFPVSIVLCYLRLSHGATICYHGIAKFLSSCICFSVSVWLYLSVSQCVSVSVSVCVRERNRESQTVIISVMSHMLCS